MVQATYISTHGEGNRSKVLITSEQIVKNVTKERMHVGGQKTGIFWRRL